MYGNYCNVCGTKLEDKAQEITCPCCKGTGKINPIHPPYSWMTPEYLFPHAVVNSSYTPKPNPFYQAVEVNSNATPV
jgi:predicted amidophosphoribosyltransferase